MAERQYPQKLVASNHAVRRENRRITREELRRRIDGQTQLEEIMKALTFLSGSRDIEVDPQTGQILKIGTPLDATQISAVKAEIDTRMKLLNKIMPDLKAVELTGDEGDPLVVKLVQFSQVAAQAATDDDTPNPEDLF